ncbi:MAG TPA: SpoIIE family protein phosphatase [Solirubrobacteraceae bacterium]|nr:SpoIIE family protein phosphatase [Solirubrobacteraceae bacterium]
MSPVRADLPNVLLVDDRTENLLALEAVLAPLDCNLVSVTSGQEALRRLLHDEFALILLDVQMPELDGFETAEYIKRRRKTRTIPIIFVTAISKERENVFRGYETGAVDYVFKPYDPQLLRAKVQVFLELYEANRSVARSEELLRATFDSAPIGMARLDEDGAIQQVNRALTEVLGVREAQLLGRSIDAVTHPEDAGLDAAQRRDLLRGRRVTYEVEKRLVDGAGTEIPAQLSFSVARDEDGGLRALLVQVQDISERLRAQRAWEELVREQAARAQAEAAAERQRMIRAITDAALAPLGLQDLLAELLARISDVLGVDGAAIVLEEEGLGHVVVHAAGEAAAYVREHGRGQAGGLAERVMAGRRAIVVPDISKDSSLTDHPLGGAVRSLVGVPLLADDRPIGALEVGTIFARTFSESDVDLLQLAADRAALAIERVRLFERQQKIAEELQRSLLPQSLPTIPGVAMAARYLPGGAGTRVGGDWYDTISLPGGRVGLVIGDVAGRGVSAAATMGQLRSALRAYILDGATPAQALERLNRFLLSLEWDSMATVCVLLLEPATGRLTFANAGHPPPMLLGADGVARSLKESLAVPLGALDVVGYEEGGAVLDPGATLVLYTDGLVEQRDELIDRGIERLELSVVEGGPDEPEPMCERVLRGTIGGTDKSHDDVTLVVVRASLTLGDRLEMELIGEPPALTAFRQALRRWLSEAGADDSEVQDVVMAVNEAAQNAIEHAYGLTAEPFTVTFARDGGEVSITVRDRGGWRETVSDDRGRGLPLMRALMDSVEIEQRPSGSTVVLRRALKAAAQEPAATR